MEFAKKSALSLIFGIAFLLTSVSGGLALDIGQPAPDFDLASTQGGKVRLSSLKGKNVLINFYTLDFSPT
jgi:hypothetical protein